MQVRRGLAEGLSVAERACVERVRALFAVRMSARIYSWARTPSTWASEEWRPVRRPMAPAYTTGGTTSFAALSAAPTSARQATGGASSNRWTVRESAYGRLDGVRVMRRVARFVSRALAACFNWTVDVDTGTRSKT